MGYIYQKRNGRSWILRKQSLELWPKWIKLLQEFNPELHIEKRLIQLTTNDEKFEKLNKFVNDNTNQGLEILEKDSIIIKNINKISAKNKDAFKSALSNKENPNRIVCVDHSFLGFDYGTKTNFIKNSSTKDISDLFRVVDITTPFESEMIKWIKKKWNQFINWYTDGLDK